MPLREPKATEIVLFHPCDSLIEQMTAWARKRPGFTVRASYARLLPEMRRSVEKADFALVDATEDEARAAEAFAQAAARLGSSATVMYTERMHEGLELLVRVRGALLLLGPMGESEWEGFLERALQRCEQVRTWGKVA